MYSLTFWVRVMLP